jgi:alpha/beta hydrolase family protein
MTASLVQRDAELRLRAPAGPLQTRVWWPHSPPRDSAPGLLMFFVDETVAVPGLRELSSRAGLVVVAVPCTVLGPRGERLPNAMTALEWAADHARELDADPGRLVVGGSGTGAALAAAAALSARDRGWPAIARQLLIGLDLAGRELLSMRLEGVAPATLVSSGAADDSVRYATRLRRASVDVEQIPDDLDDLARALA